MNRPGRRSPGSERAAGLIVALIVAGTMPSVTQAAGGTADETGAAPIPVQWRAAKDLFIHPERAVPASVMARNQSRIAAETVAVVTRIEVDVGQPVAAGALLAMLDPRDAELAQAQAQGLRDGLRARLALARDQLQRARQLKTDNFVSADAVSQRSAEVVTLQAELQGADAQVALAERQLAKTIVRAPFEAIVSVRNAQLGELVSPGTPLFTLVETDGAQVSAALPVNLAAPLETKPLTPFSLHAAGTVVALRLLRMSPVVDRASRTREARFTAVDPRSPLMLGSEGRLVWQDPLAHLAAQWLVRREGRLGVFTVTDGRARFIEMPLAQEGRPVPVDLADEQPIVTEGQARLQDGQPVQAVRATP